MIFINRSELNKMRNNVIDQTSGMTELDLFELRHASEDWKIIDDINK